MIRRASNGSINAPGPTLRLAAVRGRDKNRFAVHGHHAELGDRAAVADKGASTTGLDHKGLESQSADEV